MGSERLLLLPALALLVGASEPSATLDAFEQALAAQPSATAALGGWCALHRLAAEPAIRATIVSGRTNDPPDDLRRTLGLKDDDRLGYRHVRLYCGTRLLSEAHNWYAPARLSAAMNKQLDNTDTPFGQVAAPLGFSRERLGSQRGAADRCAPGTILSHRARLVLPDGQPLALVVECYTRANLK